MTCVEDLGFKTNKGRSLGPTGEKKKEEEKNKEEKKKEDGDKE